MNDQHDAHDAYFPGATEQSYQNFAQVLVRNVCQFGTMVLGNDELQRSASIVDH